MQSIYPSQEDSLSANDALHVRRSRIGDRLIQLREYVLDLITRTDQGEVLNEGYSPADSSQKAGKELPGELKRFLDMAKILAIDEAGLNVDYDKLRSSQLYGEYRQRCS